LRGALFAVTIVLALAATAGLALLAFRPLRPAPTEVAPQGDPDVIEERQRAVRTPELRRYQTTATLAEDLRDALAGDTAKLAEEVWRVSKAFTARPRWTLINVAQGEASPRVRALLVVAAGVHIPDDDVVLAFLDDAQSIVRRAAALAAGYKPKGATRVKLVEGLDVPVGRTLSAKTESRLRNRLGKETDVAVRKDLGAALNRAR